MTVSRKNCVTVLLTVDLYFDPADGVDFSQSVYEVNESNGSVEICVELNGTPENYLTVSLYSIPGTATGKPVQSCALSMRRSFYYSAIAADFDPLSESLTFHQNRRQCVNVGIVTGDALENAEKFPLVLSTKDERIEIKHYYATVYIIEDDG